MSPAALDAHEGRDTDKAGGSAIAAMSLHQQTLPVVPATCLAAPFCDEASWTPRRMSMYTEMGAKTTIAGTVPGSLPSSVSSRFEILCAKQGGAAAIVGRWLCRASCRQNRERRQFCWHHLHHRIHSRASMDCLWFNLCAMHCQTAAHKHAKHHIHTETGGQMKLPASSVCARLHAFMPVEDVRYTCSVV